MNLKLVLGDKYEDYIKSVRNKFYGNTAIKRNFKYMFSIYGVSKPTRAKILDLKTKKVSEAIIKTGTEVKIVRIIDKGEFEDNVAVCKKSKFPDLRFYIYRKNLMLLNGNEAKKKTDKLFLEFKRGTVDKNGVRIRKVKDGRYHNSQYLGRY